MDDGFLGTAESDLQNLREFKAERKALIEQAAKYIGAVEKIYVDEKFIGILGAIMDSKEAEKNEIVSTYPMIKQLVSSAI